MARATLAKLDFPEKLVQTGKKETTDALLKRLKTLNSKLKVLEQDLTDTKSLDPVRKPLISNVILHHKDRGVKAYAACCLADLLRLYAPDAPYTAEELRDIFQFFSTQISLNLKTAPPVKPLQPTRTKTNEAASQQTQLSSAQRITDVPYYTEYYYILESLSTIKSVVLACDVPGGDDIVTGFFEGFVDIVRADMGRGLLKHLIEILATVLDESTSIPQGVMDVIMSQFQENGSDASSPAFQLIIDVCNRVPSRLQRSIYAHFSEIQLQHGKNPTPADLKVMSDSHALMIDMYRLCPGMMINVVQQLEDNLKAVDEIPLRQLSTKTLGTMFGMRPAVGSDIADLARAYPGAWRAWLGRRVDKAIGVRLAWVEAAAIVLSGHPELRSELEAALMDRIDDSDERVRAAICKAVGTLEYDIVLHHIRQESLKAIGARLIDKKAIVRGEAAATLAKLWKLGFSEIEGALPEADRQFGWIPQAILHGYVRGEAPLELRNQMATTFKSLILPLPKADSIDEQAWTDRLLLVASGLDEPGFRALERLTGLRGYAKGQYPFKALIRFCEENNGGVIEGDDAAVKTMQERLTFVINAISNTYFVESQRARNDLEAFAKANEARLYKLFKQCCDPTSDLRTIVKARAEFLRRVEQSHSAMLDTLTHLIDTAAWSIVNDSSVTPLLKRLQRPEGPSKEARDAVQDAAYKLLVLMAKEGAPVFRSHVAELHTLMGEKKNERLAEVSLRALAAVMKLDPEGPCGDKKYVEKAVTIALEGAPRQAKFAARSVAYSKHRTLCAHLIKSTLEKADAKHVPRLLTHMRVFSELALSAPVEFEAISAEILAFVLQKIMYRKSPSHDDDVTDEWIPEDQLQELDQAKLLGMRIITHRSLGICRDKAAAELVKGNMEMLEQVLAQEGVVRDDTKEGGHARLHMRLRAGLCALKLANAKVYDKAISPEFFELIAYLLYDKVFQVRYGMLRKLGDVLPAQRLLPRWNILPALAALDPEAENLALARSIVASCVKTCATFDSATRIDRIEMPFARLLLLLTHHPDMEISHEGAKNLAAHVELYLDRVAHRDNTGLLYHVATKLKTVIDPRVERSNRPAPKVDEQGRSIETDEEKRERLLSMKSAKLYCAAELAQIIIQNRAKSNGWTVTTFPRDIRLPKDIFRNPRDLQEVHDISRMTFLPEDISSVVRGLGRRNVSSAIHRKAREGSGSPSKKRVRSPKKAAAKKRRKSTADASSDEEVSDASTDGSGSEDEKARGEAAYDEDGEDDLDSEGEAKVGRGGKRGAKTKANKAVTRRSRKEKARTGANDEEQEDEDGDAIMVE